ncbi:hypothetical protein MLD38_007253 [Melastoma candidum]|uniref:Uncharacterized protein n=1 Tax=Melastoma candidum TaxID=119954 RepID=A0ACB9RSF4_9MYRT|nr:hypothetical protein MLD38_007253 [Melastoma candidum]
MLQRGNARRLLQDNVPWQSETIPAIVDALFDNKSTFKDTWLLIHGNDTIGKRRLARAIAEAVFGALDLVVTMNMRARNCIKSSYSEIFTRISKDEEKLVVLVENVDLADKQLVQFLSERLEIGKTSDSVQGRGGGRGQVVYILTKGDPVSASGDEQESRNAVVQMEARVVETTLEAGIDLKRKADWELPDKLKVLKTGGKDNRNSHTVSIYNKVASKQSGKGIFDLNEEASEEGGGKDLEEVSPNSSDLTGESGGGEVTSGRGLLGGIENQFSFNRSLTRDREVKELFMTKIRGSGEEVYGGGDKVRFKVEEGVLEGIVTGAGLFLNGLFEKWLKETFQTAMHIVRARGRGRGCDHGDGVIIISLCLGSGDKVGEEGYMNTCLPKTIHIRSGN